MSEAREKKLALTQEYLRECLDYDPETGVFTWRNRPREHFKTQGAWKGWNTKYSGKVTVCANTKGYLVIRLNGRLYASHRLAWLWVYGSMPTDQIDHIDGNPSNNRIANLRNVSNSENQRNAKRPLTNTSGVIGVHWERRKNKWCALIKLNGRNIHLGYFKHLEDAAAARKAAEITYGFHPNHGREAS